ncbi:B5-like protein [Moumouvirus goulette]|uniref:B5-like protein n=1 Tax=Moumouvirus goulette TaxID=1247379 RepID=M1PB13_9VIRU|nr:B5-like protein [Moumouvirus goulette]AGF85059.1 B5-like protein [Moumouvirus goulette]
MYYLILEKETGMTYYLLLLLILVYVIKIICYYYKQINMTENKSIVNDSPPTTPDRIIVTFKGSTYDITDFIKRHPGGKQILIDNNGKDIENLMLEYEHSKNAYLILEKYKIQ